MLRRLAVESAESVAPISMPTLWAAVVLAWVVLAVLEPRLRGS